MPMQVDVAVDLGMDEPPVLTTMGQDDDRGPDFQAHKAAFFFKLERELEKVCFTFISLLLLNTDCLVCANLSYVLDQRVLPAQRSRTKTPSRDAPLETASCGHEGHPEWDRRHDG